MPCRARGIGIVGRGEARRKCYDEKRRTVQISIAGSASRGFGRQARQLSGSPIGMSFPTHVRQAQKGRVLARCPTRMDWTLPAVAMPGNLFTRACFCEIDPHAAGSYNKSLLELWSGHDMVSCHRRWTSGRVLFFSPLRRRVATCGRRMVVSFG